MIEINLYAGAKPFGSQKIAGIDPSLINIKMLLVAIAVWLVPDMILPDMYQAEITEIEQFNTKLRSEQRKLQTKVKELNKIKLQIDALKEREDKLAKKIEVVKKIFKKKQNPFKILKYISANIPKDLWLNKIELKNKNLIIEGKSHSFEKIGDFVGNLKKSVFFAANIKYSQPKRSEEEVKKHIENFKVSATIVSFE